MKTKLDLAAIFTQIESSAMIVDEVAGKILAAIKEAKADTLEAFNVMTWAAYDAKGWSRRIGPPVPGDVPAPASVKVYVSTIRAAYRLEVNVLDYSAIGELRKAIRSARSGKAASSPKPEPTPPEMKGVKVDHPAALTGSLWHDAIVLWENLPEEQQSALEEAVRKLVAKYTRKAPPALRLAA